MTKQEFFKLIAKARLDESNATDELFLSVQAAIEKLEVLDEYCGDDDE